ncbi:MAG TPA: TetR/AcrR family transcriptional regulator [Mycobacteriales bacterium]|nr:TetR/AcrR family transcriptional regulator [Mycobacteriales bacterium]
MTSAPRPRGRPRSSRAHDAIIDAVLEFIAEGTTVEALSIEAVAARAGVGKATIYRRWPHKDALLLDAVASVKEPVPDLPGVSVRDDLVLLTRAIGTARDTRASQILPCMIPELQRPGALRDAYLRMVEARRDVTRGVIRRGILDGTLRPDTDVELTVALLSGPMLGTLLGSLPRMDTAGLAERVVDAVLNGIAARP